VDTVFMMTGEENFYISSSLVKEVAGFGGDVSEVVPAAVAQALRQRCQGSGPQGPLGESK
jgi:pantetheine-phosphate adenylyltransferase